MIRNRWTWAIVGLVVLALVGRVLRATDGGRGLGAVLLWGGLAALVVLSVLAGVMVWVGQQWSEKWQPKRRYVSRRARRLAGRAWVAFGAALVILLFVGMAAWGSGGELGSAHLDLLAVVVTLLAASALCHMLAGRAEYLALALRPARPAPPPLLAPVPWPAPDPEQAVATILEVVDVARERVAGAVVEAEQVRAAWAAADPDPDSVPDVEPAHLEQPAPTPRPVSQTEPYVPDPARPVIEIS
jgi:hypothetical protein